MGAKTNYGIFETRLVSEWQPFSSRTEPLHLHFDRSLSCQKFERQAKALRTYLEFQVSSRTVLGSRPDTIVQLRCQAFRLPAKLRRLSRSALHIRLVRWIYHVASHFLAKLIISTREKVAILLHDAVCREFCVSFADCLNFCNSWNIGCYPVGIFGGSCMGCSKFIFLISRSEVVRALRD